MMADGKRASPALRATGEYYRADSVLSPWLVNRCLQRERRQVRKGTGLLSLHRLLGMIMIHFFSDDPQWMLNLNRYKQTQYLPIPFRFRYWIISHDIMLGLYVDLYGFTMTDQNYPLYTGLWVGAERGIPIRSDPS
jgi:hypothetical protein